jgi:hypothetical protein
MRMHKTISCTLALIMVVMLFMLTASALAQDGEASFHDNLDDGAQITAISSSEVSAMKTYLQTRYNNTVNTNSKISENMGYLFALKGIEYVINGTTYGNGSGQVDCSGLTYYALKQAYADKGWSNYYLFGSTKRNSASQYNICSNNGLKISIDEDDDIDDGTVTLQTGDLLFWKDESGTTNHVGIYVYYKINSEDSGHHIIETTGTAGQAYVSSGIWSKDGCELYAYARLNKPVRTTFKTCSPFNENLGVKSTLYNCPPIPPSLPTHSGYVFTSWSPSITAGIRSNTTYTANYALRANSSLNDK